VSRNNAGSTIKRWRSAIGTLILPRLLETAGTLRKREVLLEAIMAEEFVQYNELTRKKCIHLRLSERLILGSVGSD